LRVRDEGVAHAGEWHDGRAESSGAPLWSGQDAASEKRTGVVSEAVSPATMNTDPGPLVPLSTLRAARLAARLRQDDLARRAGVSRTVVSNAERYPESLTKASATRIAAALGLAPEDLLARQAR
jgi:DNA-binding XRE family transcriptional regulator